MKGKNSNWGLSSYIPLAILFGAFLTNPSSGDFDQYVKKEFGVLSLAEYNRQNFYLFSLGRINSVSIRRGEDKRVVLGLFGSFVELNQTSSW